MKVSPKVWIIGAALIGVGAFFWLKNDKAGGADATGDPVVTVERRDIESSLLLTGEVTPAFQVDVKPEVGGKVKHLAVKIGDTVKKGELLAVIDDRDLQTEKESAMTDIEGARLTLEKTRGNYERASALYKQKLLSKEVYSNLEADYNIAENDLEKANRRLQTVEDKLIKTRIFAPFDGTVLDILVNEGQVVTAAASVNAGTLMMMFADLSKLLIYSHVNQADAPRLKEGQPVEISVVDGLDRPVRAHIEFVAPLATVKNNVKGFEVHAVIDDNDGRLKPGMSVSMNVPVGEATNVVSVPVTAVFREQKSSVVYVRNGEATERRPVVIGLTDLSFAEVKSGLKEGEKILLVEPSALTKS